MAGPLFRRFDHAETLPRAWAGIAFTELLNSGTSSLALATDWPSASPRQKKEERTQATVQGESCALMREPVRLMGQESPSNT
ncbi:MAG: hypothetical protein OXF56_22660 [Rhodobacteraceae bacterium]|nr:hypothetical protein [Paracoccaceae bacterium]